jgi:hypothetical protein
VQWEKMLQTAHFGLPAYVPDVPAPPVPEPQALAPEPELEAPILPPAPRDFILNPRYAHDSTGSRAPEVAPPMPGPSRFRYDFTVETATEAAHAVRLAKEAEEREMVQVSNSRAV